MSDYVQRNAQSRGRLASLCERINDEQLARIAFGEWTVSAVLAHMAFWDRIALERWNTVEREGQVTQLPEFLNSVGAADWLAIPPRKAVQLAVEAADALDKKIEKLHEDLIEASRQAMGNPRMFERFHHREDHLSAIERVI